MYHGVFDKHFGPAYSQPSLLQRMGRRLLGTTFIMLLIMVIIEATDEPRVLTAIKETTRIIEAQSGGQFSLNSIEDTISTITDAIGQIEYILTDGYFEKLQAINLDDMLVKSNIRKTETKEQKSETSSVFMGQKVDNEVELLSVRKK